MNWVRNVVLLETVLNVVPSCTHLSWSNVSNSLDKGLPKCLFLFRTFRLPLLAVPSQWGYLRHLSLSPTAPPLPRKSLSASNHTSTHGKALICIWTCWFLCWFLYVLVCRLWHRLEILESTLIFSRSPRGSPDDIGLLYHLRLAVARLALLFMSAGS